MVPLANNTTKKTAQRRFSARGQTAPAMHVDLDRFVAMFSTRLLLARAQDSVLRRTRELVQSSRGLSYISRKAVATRSEFVPGEPPCTVRLRTNGINLGGGERRLLRLIAVVSWRSRTR